MKLDKLEQPLLGNLLEILKRILLLKQRNRFKAAEAATGSTPCLKSGACAPPSGQVESRVEQAVRVLREQGHPMESTKETLRLMNWLTADIEKENLPDLAASSFDKKKVIGGCLSAAKHQFKAILDRF